MKKYDRRIVVITRETRLEKVLISQNTRSQAKFYIHSLGGDFDDYDMEDRQYHASVLDTRQRLEEIGAIQVLDRKYLPNFIFAPEDIVVAIGQDGLVANTIKYLNDQPIIGVNPDPDRWDGVLLPFTPKDAAKIAEDVITRRRKTQEVTMAKARIQNGQELLAVNDFFIGQRTHVSARYIIKHGGLKEPQSSSGVIVSTGLGSTGWMKSILAGASRISASVIGHPYGGLQENDRLVEEEKNVFFSRLDYKPPLKARQKKQSYGFSELSSVIGKWKSEELIFAVREPFPSKTTGTTLVFGKVSAKEPLRIESLMGENGVIFSDGIEGDFLAFNSGAEALITIADKRGHIVV
ncbi:MAG: hypothetical protein LBE89_03440 [Helicobacteraceae bacterium]|jgi:NAD kinase|nr:hypothetical protein [Helicobacteraceae bacterium]